MKTKRIWITLTCLMMFALVLSACNSAPATTTQPTTVVGQVNTPTATKPATSTPATTAAPASNQSKDSLGRMVETPKYGGSATVFWTVPQAFDPGIQATAAYLNLSYDPVYMEPWTKGPSGSNEYPLNSPYLQDDLYVGDLAMSWEAPDQYTCIYHLRQGVHFQNKAPANGREMTADDWVATLLYQQKTARSPLVIPADTPADKKITATVVDKYTVKFHFPTAYTATWTVVRNSFCIIPKEVLDQNIDMTNWKNECGTGPYVIQDAVVDSSVTYVRNPNYWQTDPFFPQNQLPYLDKVTGLIIADTSTWLSALRTHKIDSAPAVPWDQGLNLLKTNPELKNRQYPSTYSNIMFMRTDIAPWNILNVRKAVTLAIDRKSMQSDFYKGYAEILTWPAMPTWPTVYVPLNQMPQDIQELYTYNPDSAKKLLADAGYPTGFKATITFTNAPTDQPDLMAVVKQELAKVNIDITLQQLDSAGMTSILTGKKYADIALTTWGNTGPMSAPRDAYQSNRLYNYGMVNDPQIDATYNKALGAATIAEQNRIIKEEFDPYALRQCYMIPLPVPVLYNFWQPWLKGYSGEVLQGRYYNYQCAFFYGWIDQDLKFQMTGQR